MDILIAFILLLFGADKGPTALDIAWCESRMQQSAVGDVAIGGSYGIFQIYEPVWAEWLFDNHGLSWYHVQTDPFVNAYAAKIVHDEWERVFHEDGFNAWSCYNAE